MKHRKYLILVIILLSPVLNAEDPKQQAGDAESPIFGQRELRILGATHAEEFAYYLEAETKNLLDSLGDHPNGASLSREEALDLAYKIRSDFMEMKGLSLDNDIGRGFMGATNRLRSAKNPEIASKLLAQSEVLKTRNLLTVIKDWADLGTGQDKIEHEAWFKQLSGMSRNKFLAAIFGSEGKPEMGINPTPGLFGYMTQTHDGAVKFQMVFDQLAEKYQIGDKPFKEYLWFDALQARVKDVVAKRAIEEAQKEEDVYKAVWGESQDALTKIAGVLHLNERAILSVLLLNGSETPNQLREKLMQQFPTLIEQINRVPEDRLFKYTSDIVITLFRVNNDD